MAPIVLTPTPGSSVPVNAPLHEVLAYARRCEVAWQKLFELNLSLRTRIRELEAQIAASQ